MKKILLLIDDSLTIHRIVEDSIDHERYELFKYFSIEDVDKKLLSIDPHILLLDNKLEGVDVKKFCRDVKNKKRNCKIILLVGAFDIVDDNEMALYMADDYLSKPFNSQLLSDKIEAVLEESISSPTDNKQILDHESEVEEFLNSIQKNEISVDEGEYTGESEGDIKEIDSFELKDLDDIIDKTVDSKNIDERFALSTPTGDSKTKISEEDNPNQMMKDINIDEEMITLAVKSLVDKNVIENGIKSALREVLEETVTIEFEAIFTKITSDFFSTMCMPKLSELFQGLLKENLEKIVKDDFPFIAEKIIKEEIEKLKSTT